ACAPLLPIAPSPHVTVLPDAKMAKPPPDSNASLDDTNASLGDTDASPDDTDAAPRVSAEVLRAFLVRKDTQLHIVSVIRRRLDKGTPRWIVAEIPSAVNERVLTAVARPRSEANMRGWLTTLATNMRNQYFRVCAAHEKWINPQAEIEEQPPDPNDAP